ncbi:hypothetical protein HY405_02355 [Candidatus Microgenomates bacterium]|nr:hypothetical protein [Candidatus Microgenomates bacterium]
MELSFLNTLLAFGALVALPSIPDIICRTVGKPGQLGALAAGAIGGAIASGQKYQGQVQSGTAGFAQTAGRLPGDRGMVYDPTPVTAENVKDIGGTVGEVRGWRRPKGIVESSRVSTAGQWARMSPLITRPINTGVSKLRNRIPFMRPKDSAKPPSPPPSGPSAPAETEEDYT